MTTDPNWLKSITESYKQEVSESPRNLQEEAENLYNLVETIQTALNADFTEEQVSALINMFESDSPRKAASRAAKKSDNIINDVSRHAGDAGGTHLETGPWDDSGHYDKLLRKSGKTFKSYKQAANELQGHVEDAANDGKFDEDGDYEVTSRATRDYPEESDRSQEAEDRINDSVKEFKNHLHKKLGLKGKKK